MHWRRRYSRPRRYPRSRRRRAARPRARRCPRRSRPRLSAPLNGNDASGGLNAARIDRLWSQESNPHKRLFSGVLGSWGFRCGAGAGSCAAALSLGRGARGSEDAGISLPASRIARYRTKAARHSPSPQTVVSMAPALRHSLCRMNCDRTIFTDCDCAIGHRPKDRL